MKTHMGLHIFGREKNMYSGSTYPCALYMYFCLHHSKITTETNENLYAHYDEEFWWIIMFNSKKLYLNISIYAYFCYMVRYFCQKALIISDIWWSKENEYRPITGPI